MIDVAPTIPAAAGIPEPTFVNGVQQKPLEGVRMLYSVNDAKAAERLKCPSAVPECLTADVVAIAEEIGRRGVVREGVDELLGGPGGGGMLGDVEAENAAAVAR